eukprot:5155423-Amphidinium_carterae.1
MASGSKPVKWLAYKPKTCTTSSPLMPLSGSVPIKLFLKMLTSVIAQILLMPPGSKPVKWLTHKRKTCTAFSALTPLSGSVPMNLFDFM